MFIKLLTLTEVFNIIDCNKSVYIGGENVKVEREKLKSLIYNSGMTIHEISNASGLGRTTISKMINTDTQFSPFSIGKLAKALGVKVEELIIQERIQ